MHNTGVQLDNTFRGSLHNATLQYTCLQMVDCCSSDTIHLFIKTDWYTHSYEITTLPLLLHCSPSLSRGGGYNYTILQSWLSSSSFSEASSEDIETLFSLAFTRQEFITNNKIIMINFNMSLLFFQRAKFSIEILIYPLKFIMFFLWVLLGVFWAPWDWMT